MKKLTTDEFVKRAKMIHGDKWDYSRTVYVDMHSKVDIVCPKHGVFSQTPSNHLKGHGCPICNRVDAQQITFDEFLRRSHEVHGDRYDYSLVDFQGTKTNVKIICPVHGVFEQRPEKHMAGHQCPLCCKNHKDTTESFIRKARKVHGDLYDYSKVKYVDQHTKVLIIDPDYGEFWQQPNAHLNGRGSPMRKPLLCYATKKQNNTSNSSKPEERAYDLLVEKFGVQDVKRQYRSDVYPFACDFYIVSLDLYIELNLYVTHGGHWFDSDNPEDVERLQLIKDKADHRNLYGRMIRVWTETDPMKRRVAEENGLNYVVFWKYDMSDFLDWLRRFDDERILRRI